MEYSKKIYYTIKNYRWHKINDCFENNILVEDLNTYGRYFEIFRIYIDLDSLSVDDLNECVKKYLDVYEHGVERGKSILARKVRKLLQI